MVSRERKWNRMNEEQLYLNFDEYIKASEPHKRERAWRVAIGLQAIKNSWGRDSRPQFVVFYFAKKALPQHIGCQDALQGFDIDIALELFL